MMKRKRQAFTLLEIVIAMAMMCIVLLSMFLLNKQSNQSSMDAYYEILAFSLAREPIEVYRGIGYETCVKICDSPGLANNFYKVGEDQNIEFNPSIPLQYPAEASLFKRRIDFKKDKSDQGINYVNIKVTVSVKGLSRAETWLSRKSVVLESCIMEQPKWE